MAATVIALPQAAQTVLTAYVPYLEVDWWVWWWKSNGSDILADGGNGF